MDSRTIMTQFVNAKQTGVLCLTATDFANTEMDINNVVHKNFFQSQILQIAPLLKTIVLRELNKEHIKFFTAMLNNCGRPSTVAITRLCLDTIEFEDCHDVKRLFSACGNQFSILDCFDLETTQITFVYNTVKEKRYKRKYSITYNNFNSQIQIDDLVNMGMCLVKEEYKENYINNVITTQTQVAETCFTLPTTLTPATMLPTPLQLFHARNSQPSFPYPTSHSIAQARLLTGPSLMSPSISPTPSSSSLKREISGTSTTTIRSNQPTAKKQKTSPPPSSSRMTMGKMYGRIEESEQALLDRLTAIEQAVVQRSNDAILTELGSLRSSIESLDAKVGTILTIMQTQSEYKIETTAQSFLSAPHSPPPQTQTLSWPTLFSPAAGYRDLPLSSQTSADQHPVFYSQDAQQDETSSHTSGLLGWPPNRGLK